MEILNPILDELIALIPTGVAVAISVLVVLAVRAVLNRGFADTSGHRFRRQVIVLLLSLVGLLVIILSLPVSESTTGQLLSLLGILLSAAIALSATTFVGNIMAGLMLRAVKNFRSGDFVRVEDHFGRVSDRGLFHVEIQTEDSDLTTLPNLYLVTNPVKVVRSSGTLVTAEVSLGYDVPRETVRSALLEAATEASLTEPFVHVLELGDFSVTYRVAGLLKDVKSLLSTRSGLRENMLDRLHAAGIEIVSPTFMNQRALAADRQFIPARVVSTPEAVAPSEPPESVVFDKADEAESLEKLHERMEKLQKHLKELRAASTGSDDEADLAIKARIEQTQSHLERLTEYIAEREKRED